MKQEENIDSEKILSRIEEMEEFNQKIAYLCNYINTLLDAEKTFYLPSEEIPSKGLFYNAWKIGEPFFINDIVHDDRYDEEIDMNAGDLYSLLLYPIGREMPDAGGGLMISTGRDAHDETTEELVPIKSAGQTIGVQVKQATLHIPKRDFSSEDIDKVHAVVSRVEEALFPQRSAPAAIERSDEGSVSIETPSQDEKLSEELIERRNISEENREKLPANTILEKIKKFFSKKQ